MADLSSVRDAPMLEGVTEEGLVELEAIARLEETTKGEQLFVRGEQAAKLYIVKEGAFSLTLPLRRLGNVLELALEEKRSGDALGWSTLVAPYLSIYSCYCAVEGGLFSFERGDLARLMSMDLDLGTRISINLNQMIAGRLRLLQSLWLEEIEQSTARVDRWSQTEIGENLNAALHPPPKRRFTSG